MATKLQAQKELQTIRVRLEKASKLPLEEQQKYSKEIQALKRKTLYCEAVIEAGDGPFDSEAAEKELMLTFRAIGQIYGHINISRLEEKYPEIAKDSTMLLEKIDQTFTDQSAADLKYALKRLKANYETLDKLERLDNALIGFEVVSDEDDTTIWLPAEDQTNPFETEPPKAQYQEPDVEQMKIPGVR